MYYEDKKSFPTRVIAGEGAYNFQFRKECKMKQKSGIISQVQVQGCVKTSIRRQNKSHLLRQKIGDLYHCPIIPFTFK